MNYPANPEAEYETRAFTHTQRSGTAINELIVGVLRGEEMPDQWKIGIIVNRKATSISVQSTKASRY